jgi:hypothetical protein
MFIRDVDAALETLVRARLPLPEHVGDVSFDTPTTAWSAQLARVTVNLFLFHLDRSTQPTRAPQKRFDANGRPERRGAQVMIELGYLVSAWAGTPHDEHQLLGELTSLFAGLANLPPEYTSPALNSSVSLTFGGEELTRPHEVWQGIAAPLKPCGVLKVTVAADTCDWQGEAPGAERISALSAPIPH